MKPSKEGGLAENAFLPDFPVEKKDKGDEKWLQGLKKDDSSQLTNPNNKRGSQA